LECGDASPLFTTLAFAGIVQSADASAHSKSGRLRLMHYD
jgi:hypothetical protein